MRTSRTYDPLGSSNTQAPKSFLDYNWKLFSICGIPVHVHYLLPAYFVLSFIFWLRVILENKSQFGYFVLLIVLDNLVLWITVLIHELGHCLAGWYVGGSSEKILLWPLGGLAYTKPPLSSNNSRFAQIIIALGGPLTHIPQALFWGLLLLYNGRNKLHAGVRVDNALTNHATWTQTIYTPIDEWVDYDFLMLSYTLNVWLFIVNLLLPAFPLDGSRVFVNFLLTKYTINYTAKIYVVANAVCGIAFILLAYLYLSSGSMCQFAGLWAIFECNTMVQLLIQNREFAHPLLIEQ